MTTSAFGVELGKALRFGRPAKKAAESAAVHLDFKPIKPGVKPVGPGSLRRVLDPSAHETQVAAERRRELGKGLNLNPVARTVRVSRINGTGLARDTLRPDSWAMKGKSTHTWAQDRAVYGGRGTGIAGHRRVTGGGLTPEGAAATAVLGGGAAIGADQVRRRRVRKSAFGVEAAHVPSAAMGRLKPVPTKPPRVPPTKKLDTAIAATRGTAS